MALQAARVLDITSQHDLRLVSQLAQLHHDCILTDHMLATLLPPLDMKELLAYWDGYIEEIKARTRLIVLQSVMIGDHEEVVGAVSLYMPVSETGPFRSEVHKLVVSPKHRYKGIARSLMAKLEEAAIERGRWLVMLDTTIGSGAEYMYPKLGYTAIGVVPNYGISPQDRRLRDEMFFYKDLRPPGTIFATQASGSITSDNERPA